jgi:VanZ family protein
VACLAYVGLVIDASLYPFSGWRERGIGPFDYLWSPWPSRALEFDMAVNVLGYLPLGALAVLALYPRVRGTAAAALALVGCASLSAVLEALQTYLPTRVASKVDLTTNVAGALAGALAGGLLARPILDRGRLRELRLQWFDRDASWGLVIVALWFGAILYPQPFAFACGAVAKTVGIAIREPAWLGFLLEPSARGFAIEEALVSGCFLAGAGMLFLSLSRRFAPRIPLIFGFVAASGLAKTLSTGWTYSPGAPFAWVTRGAFESAIAAALILLLGMHLPARWRRASAQILLLVGLVLVNALPENPYFEEATLDWASGRLLNFYGLALGVSLAWPFLALAYLFRAREAPGERFAGSV